VTFRNTVAGRLLCLLLAALFPLCAQSQAPGFDELARRGQESVDSNPAQAVELFRQALALRPSWAEGWLNLGGDLYRLNRYREARDAFRKGIALAPDKGAAWAFLGLCESELGEFDQALADIRKGEALQIGGNRAFETAVRVRAALILIRATAFDEALAQLEPMKNSHEDSPAVILAAGLCALAMPLLPTELPASKRALVDLAGKGLWAAISKRPEDAKAAYRELLEKYPQEHGVHYAYGTFLMEFDQRGALAEFRQELEADPAHWPSLLAAAFLETRRGAPEVAVQLVERAVKVAPERHRWVCHAEMGHSLLAMGEAVKAVPELEAAVKLQPANSQLHYYLEKAYRQAGRKAEADREKAEFLRLKAAEDPLALPGR
jgi:tetratricopeptide (TPR) repeat protein